MGCCTYKSRGWVRRAVTAVPALVPLAWFTGHRTITGDFANGAGLEAVTVIVAVAIVALNMLLDT